MHLGLVSTPWPWLTLMVAVALLLAGVGRRRGGWGAQQQRAQLPGVLVGAARQARCLLGRPAVVLGVHGLCCLWRRRRLWRQLSRQLPRSLEYKVLAWQPQAALATHPAPWARALVLLHHPHQLPPLRLRATAPAATARTHARAHAVTPPGALRVLRDKRGGPASERKGHGVWEGGDRGGRGGASPASPPRPRPPSAGCDASTLRACGAPTSEAAAVHPSHLQTTTRRFLATVDVPWLWHTSHGAPIAVISCDRADGRRPRRPPLPCRPQMHRRTAHAGVPIIIIIISTSCQTRLSHRT